ncbi:unnamed protein product [Tuber aestivum]|uniref:Uncharacterized protein n=1 Tax=Tuber aestivum TaxID=59557 RepID=A0A292PW75_9PEZI|nr:unnamed protein product [Tuber aestivum]
MLFCNWRSTSSNPVSLGGVRGGQEFLARHLRSPSRDNDLYLLLNFLPRSLVNRGMYGKNYSPILGPGISAVTLHCLEQHHARGEYPFSTPRLVIRWTMLRIRRLHVSLQDCRDPLVNTEL